MTPGEDPEPTEDKKGHLTVTKVTTNEPANGEAYALGEEITYKITVKNDGNLTITDITVKDELNGDEWTIASLAPEASEDFETSYTVTEDDVLAGKVVNVATATGTSPDPEKPDVPVTPGEDPEPTGDPDGHLTVTKETTSETPEAGYALGDTVSYKITVTNDGNLTITDITVTDELTGDEWKIASLAPNESEDFETSYTVTEADILAGEVVNVATAKGTSPDPDEPDVPVTPGKDPEPTEEKDSHLTVTKVTTSTPANGKTYGLGETITYRITVKNDGNVTISDITVTDTVKGYKAEDITKLLDKTELAPGETATATFEHVVTEQDILAGSVKNEATATGTDPEDEEPKVEPDDTEDKTDPKDSHLTVTKVTTSEQPENGYAYGDIITYTITVTNDGNVTISDITVTDTVKGYEAEDITKLLDKTELAPGETATAVFEHEVTEQDVLAGSVKNEATAAGTDPENKEPDIEPDEVRDPTNRKVQLTIMYVYEDGTPAAESFTHEYTAGSKYSVESPEVKGYAPDQPTVTGTMPGYDLTEVVIYIRNTYRLRIRYVSTTGETMADTYTAELAQGTDYNVVSPVIAGYTADLPVVTGTMPGRDVEIIVVYEDEFGNPVEDYGESLGFGGLSRNAGECIE